MRDLSKYSIRFHQNLRLDVDSLSLLSMLVSASAERLEIKGKRTILNPSLKSGVNRGIIGYGNVDFNVTLNDSFKLLTINKIIVK